MNELRDLKRARDHIYYCYSSTSLEFDDFRAALAALFESAISYAEDIGEFGLDPDTELYNNKTFVKHVAVARAYLAVSDEFKPRSHHHGDMSKIHSAIAVISGTVLGNVDAAVAYLESLAGE